MSLRPGPRNRWQAREGSPSPLGATWIADEAAFNFALYSKHAAAVTLLLYAEEDLVNPVRRYRLEYPTNKSGRIWHCRSRVDEMRGARFYAYSVEGPYDPAAGHRFDPHKILLDPYARAVFFPPAFDRGAAWRPGSNAGRAPLGVLPVPEAEFDWTGDRRPVHTHDTVIYELHVRGFTRSPSSGVSAAARGTYAGVVERIPYLVDLGVTAVELMPIHQFDPGEGNYWGYMPLSFFAPHLGYSQSGDPTRVDEEVKAMIKALHAADIEVILDVVYNHTCEGNETGPTYGFRGIDNSTYYLLEDDRSKYRNDSGTGNVLHCANRYVRHMILDSLRYWVREMHVDGFRFDLASLFTRDEDGGINLEDPPIIAEITSDPAFQGIRLVAEAWDQATYQLGRSFPGMDWLQWNARYRDDVRSFVRGDPDRTGALMTRLYGSDDIFPDQVTHAYHAYQSVNFVTSHDGLTLHDLVSYQRPTDATSSGTEGAELSWNAGWEGNEGAPPDVVETRRRLTKLFFALLLLSNGTPMFVAGDELGRTQRGRANPYASDDEISWIDWSLLETNRELFRFVRGLLAFRRAHPSLGRSRFWRDDVVWRGARAPQIDFDGRSEGVAFFLRGETEGDRDLYVMVNRTADPIAFEVEDEAPGGWLRAIDSGRRPPDDLASEDRAPAPAGPSLEVGPRSLVVLVAAPPDARDDARSG